MTSRTAQLAGPLLTALVLMAFVVLDATVVRIQNPAPIFLIAVTFAGYVGGLRPALVSAALAIAFSAYYFSAPGQRFTYTPTDEARLAAIALGSAAIAVLTGALRERLIRAERRVARDSETRFRATVDVALDALISMDTAGRIIDWNPSAEQMFGWTRDDAVGSTMADTIIPERYREPHRAGLQRFLETGHGRVIGRRIEIEAVHRDGHELPIELAISAISTSAGQSFTAFVRDISSRRRLEATQAAALVDVQQTLRLRDEFLSAAAHDLKTPLTSVQGHLQLIRRRAGADLAPALVTSLDEVDRAVRRMTSLINELLDIARLQAGETLMLDRREMDLIALAREIVESARRQSSRHRITFEPHVDAIVGRWDAGRIERALANLVSNAIKYSPAGGEVVVTADRVHEGDRTWAVISVSDHGIGIPPADLPRLFTRFQRGSNTKGVDGSGIGLEATRRMIELHDGTIAVDTAEGEGTTFTIRLPLGNA